MLRRFFLMGLVCLGLAACASSPPSLTREDVQALGISTIRVSLSPTASISWPLEERRFAKEQVRQKVQVITQLEFDEQVKPYFQGPRKVRLDVTIEQLKVPTLFARALTNSVAAFKTSYDIVDLKTGAVIAHFADAAGSSKRMSSGPMMQLDIIPGFGESDPAVGLIRNQAVGTRESIARGGN